MPKTLYQPLGGNQMPRFGGPATMMRLPLLPSAKDLDVCFVGVPLDIGTSNRPGARFGPRQIRAESCLIRPYNMATRAAPFDSLSIADIGDVAINTFDLKKSIPIIEAAYDEILSHRLQAADHGRRPYDRHPHPSGDQAEARAGRLDTYRRPCRHQRHHVRREDRPWHAVPPRRRRGPAGRQALSCRSACARPAMPPTISTGRGSRASASCRRRSAGTSPWRR